MPEGPEVKIITEKLRDYFEGSVLQDMEKINSNKIDLTLNTFRNTLPSVIDEINCKGKFIYFILKNHYCLGFSLGIEGFFKINEDAGKNDRVMFTTNRGKLIYNDSVNWGRIYIFSSITELKKKIKKLGFDISKLNKVTFQKVKDKLNLIATSSTTIGDLLLKQSFISGVGNYIRADALFLSKIHPLTKAKKLTDNELKILKKNIFKIYNKSYKDQKKGEKYKFLIYRQSQASFIPGKQRMWFDKKIQI